MFEWKFSEHNINWMGSQTVPTIIPNELLFRITLTCWLSNWIEKQRGAFEEVFQYWVSCGFAHFIIHWNGKLEQIERLLINGMFMIRLWYIGIGIIEFAIDQSSNGENLNANGWVDYSDERRGLFQPKSFIFVLIVTNLRIQLIFRNAA